MPRLSNVKERRHQPFFDHLIRGVGNPTTAVQTTTSMFSNATTIGNPALTNLTSPGMLSSDQTFLIYALRCKLFFDGLNIRALYVGVAEQLYFVLSMGDKPQFNAPAWYTPAGGGIWAAAGNAGVGATGATPATGAAIAPVVGIYNNGEPTQEATMKLGRAIPLPVRQQFQVSATFYPVGTSDVRATINSGDATDVKLIAYYLDGLQSREVL